MSTKKYPQRKSSTVEESTNKIIIGIAGGTGCGKTTVVNQIVEQLPKNEVVVISQDSYYNDLSHLSKEERSLVNFDHPNSIDFDNHLDSISNDWRNPYIEKELNQEDYVVYKIEIL